MKRYHCVKRTSCKISLNLHYYFITQSSDNFGWTSLYAPCFKAPLDQVECVKWGFFLQIFPQ